tara:strand:+ start:891 stop:1475 length:585 start_codon:yes stop_codon:yes gene_type:complete
MKQLIKEIFKESKFTEKEETLIFNQLEKITLHKGELLLKKNEDVTAIYFIFEGCLRTYHIDDLEKEHTLQFGIKGWWISDYIALYGKGETKAISSIECIKNATLYKISKESFNELCKNIPTLCQLHISALQYAFSAFQKRILDSMTLSAKDRYIDFLKSYPEIEQSVKNYHIASFLGIASESLSRIRREIANKC